MSKQALHDALQQLDRELKARPELDEEDRALLHDVRAGLDALSREGVDALPAPGNSDAAALRPQLDDAVERFEARHPELASMASRVIELLNRLGI
jgi:hypothetical protein